MANKPIKKKFRWNILAILATETIGAIVIFWGIYLFFANATVPSAGLNLHRSDWLAFFGSYLTMFGTLVISTITVWQTKEYSRKDEQRRQEEYEQQTMPKLSISIVEKNSWIEGMEDSDTPEGKIITRLHHSNITLEIRNVGQYATTNIYVDDKFAISSLMAGEKATIHVARPSSADLRKYPNLFIELIDDEDFIDGLPTKLLLQSDDIDGNLVEHEYKLNGSDGKTYYSYEKGSPWRDWDIPKDAKPRLH